MSSKFEKMLNINKTVFGIYATFIVKVLPYKELGAQTKTLEN